MRTQTKLFLMTLFVVSLAVSAQAQATRTWVAGTGSDLNPCSRTAPCKTFAQAFASTASGGEISVVDAGAYGTLTINKSITINGVNALSGVLASSGIDGFVVQAGSSDRVVIRNMTINGLGSGAASPANVGIRFKSGGSLIVENCDIFGFGVAGIRNEATFLAEFFISGTHVHGNTLLSSDGIQMTQAGTISEATINNCVISDVNGRGIYANNGTKMSIRNTKIEHVGKGVVVDQTALTTNVTIESTTIKGCGTGLRNGAGNPTTTLNNVSIEQNGIGIDFAAGVINSYGNNKISGNSANNGGGFTPVLPQ